MFAERTSRLCRAGLTGAVIAAATVAPMTANAAIIYSGALNITTTIPGSGFTYSNVSVGGANVFGIAASAASKGPAAFFLFTTSATTNIETTESGGYIAAPLGEGVTIGASSTFSDVNNGGYLPDGSGPTTFSTAYFSGGSGLFAPGTDSYLGFTINPSGTQTLYGYAEVAVDLDGLSLTVVDTAYEDSGAGIVTPSGVVDVPAAAVPEPATAALLGIGLFGIGRRRRARAGRDVAPA